MGVRTIVNLRTESTDPPAIREAGLEDGAFGIVEIPMVASSPEIGKTRDFLAVAADASRRPLLFHCRHGADRTGAMAAAYRVVAQGWKAGDAVAEMTDGGFGFHPVFRDLPKFVMELDARSLRAAIGHSP
jgi:protein-tyrosine phosphatase